MSEIIKQSMSNIWASSGDIVAPDSVKIADGWLVEVVPRQYWNWMQNRTDTNIAYLFQHGIPEWDATVEYIANKSYVTHADVVYKAILTGTNQNPTTATTYWKVAFATSTAALEALKETTPAADKLPYFNSATTAATTTITPLARTLLDDTTQGEMRTTIGAQPVDATLTALAGVTTATNKLPYFSGVDTAAVTDLTAFGRSLIDDADATAARATLVLNNVNNTSDANKPVSVAQQAALDLKAPLLSPALTGVPTAPTAAAGTSSTQLATTAFVNAEINADRPYSVTTTDIKMDGVQSLGVLATLPRADHVHPSDTTKAPLASPVLTGTPTVPTATVGTNTTQVASTAYTVAEIGSRAPTKTGAGASGTWGISVTGSSGSCTGNASSATTLSGDASNWAGIRSSAVANMLGWKNYGNGHVIFDASAGTAPNGAAINNSNAGIAWSAAYPTLMGWNGSTTYGVRVDRAAWADRCADTGWIALSLYNGFTQDGSNPLQIRRIGNIVYATGVIYRGTPPPGLTEFTTIPSGYRPSKTTKGTVGMNADNFNWAIADIDVGVNGGMVVGVIGMPSQNNAKWTINFCWVTDYA